MPDITYIPYRMRTLILLLFLHTSIQGYSQDKIYTTNGNIINARVQAASFFRVTYYEANDSDGILRIMPGSKVQRIEYADGRMFKNQKDQGKIKELEDWKKRKPKQQYIAIRYNNVISIYAPQLAVIRGMRGALWGIGYERFFLNGFLSASIPFLFTSKCTDHMGDLDYGERWTEGKALYVAPALMVHPVSNNHRADISFGLQLASGQLNTYDLYKRPYILGVDTTDHHRN